MRSEAKSGSCFGGHFEMAEPRFQRVDMDCMPRESAATGSPAKDSLVVTWTPSGVSSNVHSWMPVMPPDVPPQRTRERSVIS